MVVKQATREIAKREPARRETVQGVNGPVIIPSGDASFTVRQAAALVGCAERWLRNLVAEGGVPWCCKLGPNWSLSREAVKWLVKRPRMRGMGGQRIAKVLRAEAARLDKACRQRQKEAAQAA